MGGSLRGAAQESSWTRYASNKKVLSIPALRHRPETAVVRMETDEREWLRGPLVAGDLGPNEIGKPIKLLKAQQDVLSDDEDRDDDGSECQRRRP
jgi:hypothetical protein